MIILFILPGGRINSAGKGGRTSCRRGRQKERLREPLGAASDRPTPVSPRRRRSADLALAGRGSRRQAGPCYGPSRRAMLWSAMLRVAGLRRTRAAERRPEKTGHGREPPPAPEAASSRRRTYGVGNNKTGTTRRHKCGGAKRPPARRGPPGTPPPTRRRSRSFIASPQLYHHDCLVVVIPGLVACCCSRRLPPGRQTRGPGCGGRRRHHPAAAQTTPARRPTRTVRVGPSESAPVRRRSRYSAVSGGGAARWAAHGLGSELSSCRLER